MPYHAWTSAPWAGVASGTFAFTQTRKQLGGVVSRQSSLSKSLKGRASQLKSIPRHLRSCPRASLTEWSSAN
jgi:hypothetical protein